MKALDLDAVKAFVFVADLQSFTRAAEVLDSTQSAISLKLRRLEEQLGRRLLERTPRQVRLSAEGAVFLESARSLVGAHERAVSSFEVERRRMTIGISQLIVGSELPALLRRINEHDPSLLIEMRVAGSGEIMQAYEEGTLDAALVVQPPGRRHQGETIFTESFAWIAVANWQQRPGLPLPLATQGASCSIRAAAVRALDEVGLSWAEVFIGKGAAVVGAAAAAGLAIAVLARRTAPSGTIDVGELLSLPALPRQEVVLYTALNDRRSRDAIRTLTTAFKSLSAA
ncbi:LysR family transcriptional regulator [Dyella mobilis]|uniref:LysR family transcriptional regulator n=1 Tax=Dyella mobilis TaxID=1849582 RepID=A0ABS2KJ53_9GAMM|nr:LysR family transcriptional regulator [Dyella mobilis]MBM7131207.1 LysR family transcriptional regulator [Dyella mobilis]GLQ98858.1 LysR family transcriptional regulator [Dyella mobilis]